MTELKMWKQNLIELKQEIDKPTIIVESSNTFLAPVDRTTS